MHAMLFVVAIALAGSANAQRSNSVFRPSAQPVTRVTSPSNAQPLLTDSVGQICLIRKATGERVCKSRAGWREEAAAMTRQ
jgi:hypothetical protein